jgi:hypothetical protein
LIANDERKLEIRPVTVARAEPRSVYISSGVEDGDQIITTSMDAPIPGTALAISGEDAPVAPADNGEEIVAATETDQ